MLCDPLLPLSLSRQSKARRASQPASAVSSLQLLLLHAPASQSQAAAKLAAPLPWRAQSTALAFGPKGLFLASTAAAVACCSTCTLRCLRARSSAPIRSFKALASLARDVGLPLRAPNLCHASESILLRRFGYSFSERVTLVGLDLQSRLGWELIVHLLVQLLAQEGIWKGFGFDISFSVTASMVATSVPACSDLGGKQATRPKPPDVSIPIRCRFFSNHAIPSYEAEASTEPAVLTAFPETAILLVVASHGSNPKRCKCSIRPRKPPELLSADHLLLKVQIL